MSIRREPVEVRVSDRTLWIGDQAYPLHAVTRATTGEIPPDRRAAVWHYAVTVASWLFPATIASSVTPKAISALITITALSWFAVRTAHLIAFLRTGLYELTIDTTEGPRRALISPNLTALSRVAFTITDAIHDPATEFRTQVDRIPEDRPADPPLREEPPRIPHP